MKVTLELKKKEKEEEVYIELRKPCEPRLWQPESPAMSFDEI